VRGRGRARTSGCAGSPWRAPRGDQRCGPRRKPGVDRLQVPLARARQLLVRRSNGRRGQRVAGSELAGCASAGVDGPGAAPRRRLVDVDIYVDRVRPRPRRRVGERRAQQGTRLRHDRGGAMLICPALSRHRLPRLRCASIRRTEQHRKSPTLQAFLACGLFYGMAEPCMPSEHTRNGRRSDTKTGGRMSAQLPN
jgi:hypothetical protein